MIDQRDWKAVYQQTVEQTLAAQGTDAHRGLSAGEARARLERYGRNELTAEKPLPAWRKFVAQFRDSLVILLLIATAISAVLWLMSGSRRCHTKRSLYSAIVVLNAIMGYVQESRAESAVAALRQMAAARAK